jgi:diguanylate cyclase (GGDEF)-like protein
MPRADDPRHRGKASGGRSEPPIGIGMAANGFADGSVAQAAALTARTACASLGRALQARACDVADEVLRRWQQGVGAGATDEVCRDVLRTAALSTETVSQFLITGARPTEERSDVLSATGKAPVRDTIALKELMRLFLFWRDIMLDVVVQEVARLGSDEATLAEGLRVVRAGSDGSFMRTAAQFDRERRRLQAVIAQDQARLQHQATHDALTDLPNRVLFLDRLTRALAERDEACCAVLFVDLDRFKDVNDSVGHSVGDEVLVVVAQRLVEATRPADTVCRLGGDEFVVLCERITGGLPEAQALAHRVQKLLRHPIEVRRETFSITASIGVSLAIAGDDPEKLLSQADGAMYAAKRRGRARVETYEDRMTKTSRMHPLNVD